MTEVFQAWQCIGCGRIDGPAQCVGICQDRTVRLVNAVDYEAAAARIEALEQVVRRIANTRPLPGECNGRGSPCRIRPGRCCGIKIEVTRPEGIDGRTQISTRVPSSTTRLVGMLK